MSTEGSSISTVAEGVNDARAVDFSFRALPGYVNRWLPCTAVKLEVAPTGEAQIVVRTEPFGDLPMSEDGVRSAASDA